MIRPVANPQRVLATFKDVAQLWGASGNEKVVADKILDHFSTMDLPGATIRVDDTAAQTKSDTGNVIIDIPASPDAPPGTPGLGLFFHMDRVPARAPGVPADEPVQIVVEPDGDIHSLGYRTNLAADDRAGYAEIREALQLVQEHQLTHGRIVVVGLTNEEVDSSGATCLDPKVLEGIQYGVCMDAEDLNTLMRGAASITEWKAEVEGRSAHSGMNPEAGISAVSGATSAVAHMGKLGAVQEGQTLNVAYLRGGILGDNGSPVTNVIPDHCEVAGEFRSVTPQDFEALKGKVENAFQEAEKESGVKTRLEMRTDQGFYLEDQTPVVLFAERAIRGIGLEPRKEAVMGGSDASPLNVLKGLPTVVMGPGVHNIHTVQEHLNLQELVKGSELVLSLIEEAVRSAPPAST